MAILFIKFIDEVSKHASNVTFYTYYSCVVDVLNETIFFYSSEIWQASGDN
jgi:hypothetical protein